MFCLTSSEVPPRFVFGLIIILGSLGYELRAQTLDLAAPSAGWRGSRLPSFSLIEPLPPPAPVRESRGRNVPRTAPTTPSTAAQPPTK